MLNSVFLLQMQEVFMHYFEKMSSASRGFPSRPLLGNCSWTLLGDFRPSDPLIAHPWKKSCGRPCNGRHSVTLGKHWNPFWNSARQLRDREPTYPYSVEERKTFVHSPPSIHEALMFRYRLLETHSPPQPCPQPCLLDLPLVQIYLLVCFWVTNARLEILYGTILLHITLL